MSKIKTNLLQKNTNWVAKMIAPLSDKGQGTKASFVSKTFNLSAVSGSETLDISALGLYRCYVNGARVGDDLLTPGWVCYDDRQPYQNYSVSDLLNEGENRIEIWLGDGWYRSQIMWGSAAIYNCWGDKIAAIAQISNDQEIILKTDDDWLSGDLPVLKTGIYFGEIFDARRQDLKESHGVTAIDFDLSLLVPQECSTVKKLDPLKPIEKFDDGQGRMIYDFGQNVGGFVNFTVRGESGANILIDHSEILGPKKDFDNRNLRSAKCQISYTLSGGGDETYEPYFTFQGYRYARITITGSAEIVEINSIPISSLPDRTSSFECSSPLVNRLVENTVWSQRANFIEVPTDCPQRDERLGWTGDAQVFASTACYLADSHDFLRKYLRDVIADQRPNGAISHVSPDPTRLHPEGFPNFAGSTGWGDAIVIIPWTLYNHYADKDVLVECYDAMSKWLDYLWSISDGPVIYPPIDMSKKGFSFGDWLQPTGDSRLPLPTIGTDCAATIYHYISTNLVSKIAGIIGKSSDQKKYAERAAKISKAFENEFITPSGRLAYSDQTSYALAFVYDLIPAEHFDAAKKYFREAIGLAGGKIGTGFIGTPALLPALTKIGAYDLASEVFLQKDVPGWLYQIEQGATTIWERWDALAPDGTIHSPEMNSYNHYAYGAVCQWLFESAAGFRSDEDNPGFGNIIFEPMIVPEMGPIKASHDSLQGQIKAEWKIENNIVNYEATVPEGASAEFRLMSGYSNVKIDGQTVDAQNPIKLQSGLNRISFSVNA